MKVALFLDVDRTLTKDFIQHVYACRLGCEPEYSRLEEKFQNKALNSIQFGDAIIELFASVGFNSSKSKEFFESVDLQPWADHLLKLEVDKFLVSSGPSYYIDKLASEFNIPKANVCRSEYVFDKATDLLKSCKAINEQQKAEFVRAKLSNYDISIGIGDNLEFDGPFVSACTIPLMTVPTERYIYVPTFNLAVTLIEKILQLKRAPNELHLDKMKIGDILASMTIKSWSVLISGTGAILGLGVTIGKFWK
jgi:phosphoserine phosphatase